MKSLIALLAFFSLSAQAEVGDWVLHAVYSADNHIGYQQREYKTGRSAGNLTLETLTADTSGNVVNSQTEDIPLQDVFTRQFAQALLSNCSAFGGTNEDLTLGGRTFPTCKMPVSSEVIKGFIPEKYQKENGVAWFGEVPVNGIVALAIGELTLIYNNSNW